MPRVPRMAYLSDGSYYHLISRSINQIALFRDREDFAHMRALERTAKRQFPLQLFHYVFMTTHFHLVVQAVTAAHLPLHLRFIKWHYARWMRKKYHWKGPTWRERYRSLPIENEQYLSACGLYVELNPVRAGLCQSAVDYAHSSARRYELNQPDDLLDPYEPTPVSAPLSAAAHDPLTADLIFTSPQRVLSLALH